jgi:hypothetical protein
VIWEGVVPYGPRTIRATAARREARSALARRVHSSAKVRRRSERVAIDRETRRTSAPRRADPLRLDDVLPLLYECGFRWVRSLDFNELAVEMLGDYKRERMFRFQHIALAAVRTPVAGWP